jgi:cell division protein FtsW (lipid II flippase)
MKNHGLWMVIGCAVPLLLIFILPSFGVESDTTYFIFIVLMFLCHIFMMRGHHGHDGKHGQHDKHDNGEGDE